MINFLKHANRFSASLLAFLAIPLQMVAQDAGWWIQNVGWDGVSHWSTYLSYVASNMGPNALPVPPANQGRVDTAIHFEAITWYRQGRGDRTFNPEIRISYPFSDRANLAVRYVPVEWFSVSHQTKTDRRIFFESYDLTTSAGDFYVDAQFQVLKEENGGLDLGVRSGVKTASGTARSAARHTDAPGYYFDAGVGKQLISGERKGLRVFAAAGFYAYQTGIPNIPQNDAFMYGLGISGHWGDWGGEAELSGYQGYFDTGGDKPFVFRVFTHKDWGAFRLGFRAEKGLQDFPFTSGAVSLGWAIQPGKK